MFTHAHTFEPEREAKKAQNDSQEYPPILENGKFPRIDVTDHALFLCVQQKHPLLVAASNDVVIAMRMRMISLSKNLLGALALALSLQIRHVQGELEKPVKK